MNISVDLATSRPLGVATNLARHPIDAAAVYSKVVVLTCEAAALVTANGRCCFLYALALLSRVFGHVKVALPPDAAASLRSETAALCSRAWSRGSIRLVDVNSPELFESAQAILNIGCEGRPLLPWTSINSNGWIARVSSREPLPPDTHEFNPIAALMAASLGVTEVFKRVFEIPEATAPLLERTEFSLFDFTVSPNNLGPSLPARLRLPDTLLTGAGAIGNAIAVLLAHLRVEGRLHVIDRQRYRDENLGTCMLTDMIDWLHQPKAVRLSAWLSKNGALTATGEEIAIEDALAKGRVGGLTVELILNGLDDVDARRHTQRLWPSMIIDGAINEVGAAVIQHRLDRPDSACLMCWFEARKADEKVLQRRWTGLHRDSLAHIDRQLTDQDIAAAEQMKQAWLRDCQRQGKTVCSIITEAQLGARLGVAANDGFRPSVPFVASASAALAVAAAVKAHVFPHAPAPSLFQIGSLFLGPADSASCERYPSQSCQCVLHRKVIQELRRRRATR